MLHDEKIVFPWLLNHVKAKRKYELEATDKYVTVSTSKIAKEM